MKKKHSNSWMVLVFISAVIVLSPPVQAAVVDFDRFYPTYDEVVDFLDDLDASPIVALHIIGASDESPARDIKAIKISDNPDVEEDEPAFLFVGVIHGNEPLGIRVVLQLIETLTELYASDAEVQNWVNAYEIWIVPVLNPYGYDNSRRKNGPNTGDPNTSGVDLNRNFDFRWDTWADTDEDSSQYRGPWAGSEPEVQAISNFVLDQRPAFGVTFHAGRGGTIGEVMYPWNPIPPTIPPDPPDRERLIAVAEAIADAIESSRGGVDRPDLEDAGSLGQSNVYHHAITGMFDYMLEMSDDKWNRDSYAFFYDVDLDAYTPVQLADLATAQAFVKDYLDGIKGLLRYFLFDATAGFTFRGPGVTGLVYDWLTGEPLTATVKVIELDDTDGDGDVDDDDLDLDADGDLDTEFRTGEPLFGRYLRLLEQGTWTFEFSMDGYLPTTTSATVVDSGAGVALIDLDVPLDPGIDSDSDGLTDCEEMFVHGTDTLDSDTDDDGLIDGDEVNVYGTDPLDADSDDDGLTDGDEVNVHGTDPLDADTDDDGLTDGIEVIVCGTDPLDSDSDDDGLLDGSDVEFIQNVVNGLPDDVFKSNSHEGHRNAICSILDAVESYLLDGKAEKAVKLLQNLRRHADGGRNDWIIDDEARELVRDLIDLLLGN